FLSRLHEAEISVVDSLRRLIEAPSKPLPGFEAELTHFEESRGISLARAQRAAVEAAARDKCAVITGGPGVGKTTIVQAILAVAQHSKLRVRLAAPTGRAAKRLAESTEHEATTIHRLLEVDARSGGFQRDA